MSRIWGGRARVIPTHGRASAPAVSPDNQWIAFVEETDDTCRIAVVDVDGTRASTPISHSDFAFDPQWSPQGDVVMWHAWDLPAMPFHESRIESVCVRDGAVAGAVEVVGGAAGVAVAQPRFSPEGARIAYLTDEDGWQRVCVQTRDGSQRALIGEPETELGMPTWGTGMRTYAWSPDGTAIAANVSALGFGALTVFDVATGAALPVARAWHLGIDWSASGIAAIRSGAKTPRQVVTYDADGLRTLLLSTDDTAQCGVPHVARTVVAVGAPGGFRELVEPEPVTWTADGRAQHGLWWQPHDVVRPPVLVHVHGGPTDQARADWDARRAYFVDRGWAVFAPNVGGSTGYGRAYADQLHHRWGARDVDDVAAGITSVIATRNADPDRVVIMGGSAGGLVALSVALQHPDVVSGAISVYGVSDITQLADTTWRFETGYSDWLVGTTPEDVIAARRRSPIARAADLAVPLLLLHGADDHVVPVEQHEALLAVLANHNTRVDAHVYVGEGHGWSQPETVLDELERIEEFLHGLGF